MHTALQMTEHPPKELTPDGHHVIINGRRWRATDPEIPDDAAEKITTVKDAIDYIEQNKG